MRKVRIFAIAMLILALCACMLVACGGDRSKTLTIDHTSVLLKADGQYDYISDVRLNTEKYPELERQGLRLITGYGDDYSTANEIVPDNSNAIEQYFKQDKGIMIIINGLQLGVGRYNNVNMQSDSRLAELERYGKDKDIDYFKNDSKSEQNYDLGKYWFDNGYNVFYFHWEMFADYYNKGSIADTGRGPGEVQERIWSTDTGVQAAYTRGGKTYMTEFGEAVNGSLAEWFAADYMRMAAAVSEVFPDYATSTHDIRIAGHSMGGVLTVAGGTLLHMLSDANKLPKAFVPNRFSLMDSYLAISSNPDLTVSWSGKKYYALPDDPDDSSDGGYCNYIPALDLAVNTYGVAAEFVCNEGFLVPFKNMAGAYETHFDEDTKRFDGDYSDVANYILDLCPIILVRPYFSGLTTNSMAANGHNAVREWYLSTILYDAPKAGDVTVPTARMSDKDVRSLRGRFFVMNNERKNWCETVRPDDDDFSVDKSEIVA